MTFMIVVAFVAFIGVGFMRTWKLRRNPRAWQPWAACVVASIGIASVLFDEKIDAVLGAQNWVFVLETWSVYLAYALMTETCRAVRHGSTIELRGWVMGLVAIWCTTITLLFVTLSGREGTRSRFVREMLEQPQALIIGVMYSLGTVLLALHPLLSLRSERGTSAWLIRCGSVSVIVAHTARLIVTPIDFSNSGEAGTVEIILYGLFTPTFYLGLASFAGGLMGFSMRRWYRETVQYRRHLRQLKGIALAHDIDVSDGTSSIAHLIAVEDATRSGTAELTGHQLVVVSEARSWLDRTHDAGPRMRPTAEGTDVP